MARKKYGRFWNPKATTRGNSLDFSLLNALGDLCREQFEHQPIPTLAELETLAAAILQTDEYDDEPKSLRVRDRVNRGREINHQLEELRGRRRKQSKYASEEWDTGICDDPNDGDYVDDDASYDDAAEAEAEAEIMSSRSRLPTTMSMHKYGSKQSSNPKYSGRGREATFMNGTMRSRYQIPTLYEEVIATDRQRQLDLPRVRKFYENAQAALGNDYEQTCRILEIVLDLYKNRSVDHMAAAAMVQSIFKDFPHLLREFFALTGPLDVASMLRNSAKDTADSTPFSWNLTREDVRNMPVAKRPREFGLERYPLYAGSGPGHRPPPAFYPSSEMLVAPIGGTAVAVAAAAAAAAAATAVASIAPEDAARAFVRRAKAVLCLKYPNFLDQLVALRMSYRANQLEAFEKVEYLTLLFFVTYAHSYYLNKPLFNSPSNHVIVHTCRELAVLDPLYSAHWLCRTPSQSP